MAAKRKPTKAAVQSAAPWDRGQFSVRLTEARRACLRLISDAMPQHATPNDAVDRAIEIALSKLLPREHWDMTAHVLIFHGRRVCSAIKPNCGACGVNDVCPSAFVAETVGRKPPRARR